MDGTGDRATAMTTDATALRSLLTSATRVFWAGASPPLSRMESSNLILDPKADYRMPASFHQAFDLVYLVEKDLGKIKAWPLVVDEALRLLRPGGMLVIRMTNSRLCSIFELKHQLFMWGNLSPEFEFVCDDGAIQFAVKNRAFAPRPTGLDSFSFGVITDGKRQSQLFAFLDSVREMRRRGHQRVEMLVCGPAAIRSEVEARYPGIVMVDDDGEFTAQGWITRKKNQLIARATGENVVIAHDRYTVAPDFLESLHEFGGDFACVVCKQLRPDGRRFPDWVALGSAWSWTAPAMLEYGDWSRHLYINGGIIIAKTALLRSIPWNELLFWNQAEDVELTRRLRAAGHVPRFARGVSATSHVTRHGTMESFEPMPTNADRQLIPGPLHATAEMVTPGLPYATRVVFGAIWNSNAAACGVSHGETWTLRSDGMYLPRGCFGEIAFRLATQPQQAQVVCLALATVPSELQVIVNDEEHPFTIISPGLLQVVIRKERFALSRVLRMHLRTTSKSGMVVKHMHVEPEEWSPGMRLPVSAEAVAQLAQRPELPPTVDGGALVLSDLTLLARGARRIALLMPTDLGDLIKLSGFVSALRAHARPDTIIRIVADAGVHTLFDGFDVQVVQWAKVGQEPDYLHQCVAALNTFAPDIIVNAFPVRPLQTDLFVLECMASGIVGFGSCAYEFRNGTPDTITGKYTRLVFIEADATDAVSSTLCHAVGLPLVSPALWPDRENRVLAAAAIANFDHDGRCLALLGDDHSALTQPRVQSALKRYRDAGWKIIGIGGGGPETAKSLRDVTALFGDDAVNLAGTLGVAATFSVLQRCTYSLGGSMALQELAALAGCVRAPEELPIDPLSQSDNEYDIIPAMAGASQ